MAHQTDVQSPASKKLGSKLKKSKDSTGEEGSADAQKSTPSKKDAKSDKKDKTKRKSVSDDAAPETDGEMKKKKKRRHAEDDNDQKDKDDETHKKKKKRVSFGPGTKEFDGDSESESDDVESNDAATDGAEADTEDAGDKAAEEMKQRKRDKKKQRKDGTASAEAPIHETPILSYLSHYHRARATWKFQKNRETNLFKHLYSLEHVPSKYNTSLLAYMQGLKGDAAKERMSNAAREVIKADMDLDKPKEDEEAETQEPKTSPEYLEAINAFRECLPKGDEDLDNVNFGEKLEGDVQKRLPKRQRAELVFFAVAGKLFGAEDLKKPKPKRKAPEPVVNKKRKNRTMVVDISSSSEDSDDDTPAPKKAVSKPAPDSDDDTSSSGSSSSSSDSDSDDKSSTTPAPAKQSAAKTPLSSVPSVAAVPKETKAAKKKKEKFVPVREEKLKPAVPKKTQKRKLRTAQIEISSSESDSE